MAERDKEGTGEMTVREAGHLGGEKGGHKGGEATLNKYGPEFYSEIGHKGGEKVRELVEEGKQAEQEKNR
ncbi:MAG TPA: KGG domain-containing protein [Oscillatoriaceae cyanobacterium]